MRQLISKTEIGQVNGALTCIDTFRVLGRSKSQCKCICGNIKVVELSYFKNTKTKDCCCASSKKRSEAGKKGAIHNAGSTRLYTIWENMRQRCYNPNTPKFYNYGGRGIIICEEWKNYINFAEWANANGYADKLTLDRKDNNQNYTPDNCQWITNLQQQANKRNSVYLTYLGEKLIVSEWARRFNINKLTIAYRMKTGKSMEQIFGLI